ncbi:MAG: S-methyl-5-thioribose-1-phosphate isomerase [Candidatus Omnitrophota bacterium]
MRIQTVDWKNNKIKIVDQTKLPARFEHIYINELKKLWRAIKIMQVRGAPALGAVAGLGVYLGIRSSRAANFSELEKELDGVIEYIGSSRPTAKNLFWGLKRMKNAALANKHLELTKIKQALLKEAKNIIEEDKKSSRSIGRFGAKLIKGGDKVLTICNAGILATIDYGTALALIYRAKEEGKHLKVFACETRPLLQGARLTAWELKKKGIDVTLICDNTAAALMQQGLIDKVIAGADRIAFNGDTANKIGTFNLAILCKYHKIPFYIAAPASTFDLSIHSGKGIPIEERPPQEVSRILLKAPVAAQGVKIFNPAFDITPHHLITAIITDRGIIRTPYKKNIAGVIGGLK